jgi:hypothetical protein
MVKMVRKRAATGMGNLTYNFVNSAILPLDGFEPVCFSNGGDNLSLEQRKGMKTLEPKQPENP